MSLIITALFLFCINSTAFAASIEGSSTQGPVILNGNSDLNSASVVPPEATGQITVQETPKPPFSSPTPTETLPQVKESGTPSDAKPSEGVPSTKMKRKRRSGVSLVNISLPDRQPRGIHEDAAFEMADIEKITEVLRKKNADESKEKGYLDSINMDSSGSGLTSTLDSTISTTRYDSLTERGQLEIQSKPTY